MKLLELLRHVSLFATIALSFISGTFSASLAQQPNKSFPQTSHLKFPDDPVHQAGLKTSADSKIVFVLGAGFDEQMIDLLKNDLNRMGLSEHKHYEILSGANSPRESGVVYIGGEILRLKTTNQPLIFDQYDFEYATIVIGSLIKGGIIVVK